METTTPHEQLRVAFEQLVDQFQTPIRRYLFHLTQGNAPLCDDLAQETFIKAYKHYYACTTNRRSWLFRIAHNTFIDHTRTVKNNVTTDYLTTAYASATHIDMLRETMQCLDANEKQLIVLSCIEQLSHSDITKITDIPLGTVKTIIRRAKGKLKIHLRDEQ